MENINEQGRTGYPSIDRPWIKHYRETPMRIFNTEQNTYQLIIEANQSNLDSNAINFMGIEGNSWTYREMFELEKQLANAFIRQGIKVGETVLIATVSGLEEPLCLLSLNRIGAVSKWIDITLSEDEIRDAIEEHNCKVLVIFSYILPKIQNIIDKTNVKKVLVVEPKQYFRPISILGHSLSAVADFVKVIKSSKEERLPSIPKDNRYIRFIDFLKTGDKGKVSRNVDYEKNRPVLMIQSSGTTGKPKTIVHTNYSINSSISKWNCLDYPLYAGDTMLQVAPAWVGYGLINTMATALAYGMEVLMTPALKENMLITYNQKYDLTFGVPIIFRYLDSHLDEIDSMSRPKAFLCGGDKIEKLRF